MIAPSPNTADFTLNAPPNFAVSQSGSIQSVTFTALNSLADSVVEGDEMVVVRARGQPDVYEITGTNGLVLVNIVDDNCKLPMEHPVAYVYVIATYASL